MPVSQTADDTFDSDGALSRAYLLRRGTCCGNGCRNCPYDSLGFVKDVAAITNSEHAAEPASLEAISLASVESPQ